MHKYIKLKDKVKDNTVVVIFIYLAFSQVAAHFWGLQMDYEQLS